VKGLDRAGAQHGLLRCEINQIIGVDDQRAEAEGFAAGAKGCAVHFGDARRAARPHARVGGENLQRVAAELVRRLERVEVTAGDRGVNPTRSGPSIQLGGAGSGSGSGRYSSSGSNSMTFVRGCSGIPNENSAPCVIGYSNTDGGLAFSWGVGGYGFTLPALLQAQKRRQDRRTPQFAAVGWVAYSRRLPDQIRS